MRADGRRAGARRPGRVKARRVWPAPNGRPRAAGRTAAGSDKLATWMRRVGFFRPSCGGCRPSGNRPRAERASGRVGSCRYASVVVSVDELRVSMERYLDELSDEAKRLGAALQALGPGDRSSATSSMRETSRSRGSRRRRTDTRGAARPAASEASADGLALIASEIAGATGPRRPTIAATPSNLSTDARPTAEDSAAAAPGDESAPATGADRALQELRSELTAALRNSRS
jgi:hypothetical protein